MPQLLTLSRAAHLLGVARSTLQRRIGDGELASFDGLVSTDDLRQLYPALEMDTSGAFERVMAIKDQSFGRRVRERLLPSQEILAQRLVTQSEELADVRRHLARYHDMVEALRERIDAMSAEATPADQLADLGRFLDDNLAAVLGSEEKPDTLAVMDDVLKVISAHVTVRPSGHEFYVEGSETVLEAALRAGLAPSYGCGNGNCGLCKARVVDGQVRSVRPSDYVFSAAEKAQNYALLCSCTALTDVVVELIEADSPDDIPQQELVTKVRSVAPLDGEVMLLHLQAPRSERLRFLAGQSATLGVAGGTADFSADYPVASCPCDDRNLLFHISRQQADGGDEFAQRLFAGAIRTGDPINVRGPWGTFVLHKDSTRPLVFVVCDTGFAPARSLIESAIAVDRVESITLIWAATRPGGQYLANQCRAWVDALDNFHYRPLDAADAAQAGREAAALLLAEALDGAACDIYIAGPEGFVRAARQGLADHVPDSCILDQVL